MRKRLAILIFAALLLCVSPALAYEDKTGEHGRPRAVLIGVEHFANASDAYPAASRNVLMLRDTLSNGLMPEGMITVPKTPPADAGALRAMLLQAFADSRAEDLCLVYLCSHGRLLPDGTPVLLLSDGAEDAAVTPEALERAFDGVRGHILLILDTCYSGAFIGKGLPEMPETLYFRDGRFSVITSCGGCEESWYYLDGIRQGAFYFTELLTQAISRGSGTPCDLMRDGELSLSDLYRYLNGLSGTSHPQCYPQNEERALFYYDAAAPLPDGPFRDAVQSPVFRDVWMPEAASPSVAFTVARPARVAYQLVPWQEKWDFTQAILYYDTAESEGAPDAYRGYLTPGRKNRTFSIDVSAMRPGGGYLLFQLLSVNAEETLRVHASRVLSIPAADAPSLLDKHPCTLSVQVSETGECQITVRHPAPCVLTLYFSDDSGQTREYLCLQSTNLPMNELGGQVFYADKWPKTASRVIAVLDFGGGVTQRLTAACP